MPFGPNGTFTPVTGATTATVGAVIKSATWNSVFTDISTALTQLGNQTFQPTTPFYGLYLVGILKGANMNSTVDQAIAITAPTPNYLVQAIRMVNPSRTLSAAAGGYFSAANKGGATLVATNQAFSGLTTNSLNIAGNAISFTPSFIELNAGTLYLSNSTVQGTAATCDVYVFANPLP
jgi:hypothetical protein